MDILVITLNQIITKSKGEICEQAKQPTKSNHPSGGAVVKPLFLPLNCTGLIFHIVQTLVYIGFGFHLKKKKKQPTKSFCLFFSS